MVPDSFIFEMNITLIEQFYISYENFDFDYMLMFKTFTLEEFKVLALNLYLSTFRDSTYLYMSEDLVEDSIPPDISPKLIQGIWNS